MFFLGILKVRSWYRLDNVFFFGTNLLVLFLAVEKIVSEALTGFLLKRVYGDKAEFSGNWQILFWAI